MRPRHRAARSKGRGRSADVSASEYARLASQHVQERLPGMQPAHPNGARVADKVSVLLGIGNVNNTARHIPLTHQQDFGSNQRG